MTRKHLLRIELFGGLGGAINAALCYIGWPAPAADGMDFSPWVIPAGFAHGALLAVCAAGGLTLLQRLPTPKRLAAIPVAGWIVGWLTFIPLHLAIQATPTSIVFPSLSARDSATLSATDLLKALWPFERSLETLWIPFLNFGAVAVVYWLLRPGLERVAAARQVVVASWIGAGVLGSLWWWGSYGPWWFSVLHGAIWGGLVGAAHIFPQDTPAA